MFVKRSGIVLREEQDAWALLFNPDDGAVAVINTVGVAIWKVLDSKITISGIIVALASCCDELPCEIEAHVSEYLRALVQRGFVLADSSTEAL